MDLEELTTRLRAGRFDLDEVAQLAVEAADAIESLQRELEEARKDADRVDYLDKNPRKVVRSTGYQGSTDSWVYRDYHGATRDAANLRNAIDAARQKQG
jgi:exonuclease VII small subunit